MSAEQSDVERKRYEMMVLFRPELEADMTEPLKVVSDLVKDNDGAIITEKNLGRKELAYKIKHEGYAVYYLYELSLPAAAPAKISGVLNITDSVLRHIIVKIDEKAEKVLASEKAAREARTKASADEEA